MHCVYIIWWFKHAIITCYATPECPCWFWLSGTRQAVRPGEEVPHADRREKLSKARWQQQHERGEQVHAEHHVTTASGVWAGGKLLQSGTFVYSGQLFKQELLHISEPDLIYVDGSPHSPCPSSASFSSSHIPSPELYPVRLQEVNLERA